LRWYRKAADQGDANAQGNLGSRRVYREACCRGLDPLAQPGSLWHTDELQNQEEVLACQFYKTILPLVQFEVPMYFPEFPRLARDPNYLFRTLQPLMGDHDVGHSEFLRAHDRSARPELIHDFKVIPAKSGVFSHHDQSGPEMDRRSGTTGAGFQPSCDLVDTGLTPRCLRILVMACTLP